ncbi:MAG TPA: hypothetical protein VD886_07585 [Herpetosiphonaceae bacterium]|nr:hypothetical protein [Herpetosiphonaceae bacterium]
MSKSDLAFISGATLGALTIGLLGRFAFGPSIPLSIPIVAAITVLYQIGLLVLELWLGPQKAIGFGWATGALVGLIGWAMSNGHAFLTARGNLAVLPTWLLTDLALRSLKPKLKAWLGRPTNRD